MIPRYLVQWGCKIAENPSKLFLPAAKQQGQVELWVEKKEKRVMDFWSLKLLVIVAFGMFLFYFELL